MLVFLKTKYEHISFCFEFGRANSLVKCRFFFSSRWTFCLIEINISFIYLLCVCACVTGNKMVQILLRDLGIELAQKYDASLEWTQTNYTYLMQPAFYAILISIFTMMIIYFDSDIPGINPPTPFSPRKANQYVCLFFRNFDFRFKIICFCFFLIKHKLSFFLFPLIFLGFGMRFIEKKPII